MYLLVKDHYIINIIWQILHEFERITELDIKEVMSNSLLKYATAIIALSNKSIAQDWW